MGDLLCLAKERAISKEFSGHSSSLFTVATLTGHACNTVGVGYSICMDNGPAKSKGLASKLFNSGHLYGDPCEVSNLRREDFSFVKAKESECDVYQRPSGAARGHQYPAAFLIIASGLDKHGIDSDFPLSYCHVDMAASCEEKKEGNGLPTVTGSPIVTFCGAYF